MDKKQASGLKRPLEPIPTAVSKALEAAGLMKAYSARPAYQQNDYLRWIAQAKLKATQDKRLNQMLEELQQGHVYMKMQWDPATSLKR